MILSCKFHGYLLITRAKGKFPKYFTNELNRSQVRFYEHNFLFKRISQKFWALDFLASNVINQDGSGEDTGVVTWKWFGWLKRSTVC